MSFKNLNLHTEIDKALEEAGFITPTPIQEKAIPKILKGFNLRISAQTGTGKTAAFILPALNRLTLPTNERPRGPRILILVPTRELAMQVSTEVTKFSKYLPKIKTVCIYGGAPYPFQNRQLARPYDILVATPGRLIDHLDRQRINLSHVEMLILDEADRMLDMGFIKPVEKISAAIPPSRQTLLFSATMSKNILFLSKQLMEESQEINVTPEHSQHKNIEQRLYYVDDLYHKYRLLHHILSDPIIKQTIVFTSTKRFADELVNGLRERGYHAAALHGDMNQRQRNRTITQLRNEEIRILVATDVAARGIDVQTVSHVINFDLPNNQEDYVHRIGRTGRAGASGIALSFASSKDKPTVMQIEQFIGQSIVAHVIPGLEPTLKSNRIEKEVKKRNSRHSKYRNEKKAMPEIQMDSKNRNPTDFKKRSQNNLKNRNPRRFQSKKNHFPTKSS